SDLGIAGGLVLGLQPRLEFGQDFGLLAQVVFELSLLGLQVGQQLFCIDHAEVPEVVAAGAARWRFSSQDRGRWVQSAGVMTGSTAPSSTGGWWLSPGSRRSRAGRWPVLAASRRRWIRSTWP